tara:strand:- start:268 stop:912 length:645 start_codon:yes stop_codon:yes gene_type:complete
VEVDVRVTQLLCSRLCHDLVGGISAVNTGIEFMTDSDVNPEALDLVNKSADRVTRRLNFFRGALGYGGGYQGPLSLEEARQLVHGWYLDAKPGLSWTAEMTVAGDNGALKVPEIKMLMLVTIVAEECLVRGGRVEVHAVEVNEGLGVAVRAVGEGARLSDEFITGLNPNCATDSVTARNVIAHWAQRIAHSQGSILEAETTKNEIQFAALFSGD